MRVLLAGASGAIGRSLVPKLIAHGHDVTGITRHHGALRGSGATELVVDVLKREEFLAAVADLRFDAIIHELSSLARPAIRHRHMRQTNQLRTEGTSTLLAAAKITGAWRFVAASVFLGYGLYDHHGEVLYEDAPFGHPSGDKLDSVHESLLSNELQTLAFGGVVLRYGLFYSARGPIPPVASDWDGVLPWVNIDDAADATVLALENAPRRSVYNIVDDTPASWREVHRARADAFDLPHPQAFPSKMLRSVAPFASRLMTGTSMRVSNESAREELGWTPKYPSYRDAIAEAVADSVHAHARAVTARWRMGKPGQS